MSTTLIIAGINNPGPKATAVSFVKSDNGTRPWAWVSNSVAAQLAPGMRLIVPAVSEGKIETSYTDKNGNIVDLKVPKVQLFLGGDISVDAPEAEELPEASFTATDAAAEYLKSYLAKRAGAAAPPADEPF